MSVPTMTSQTTVARSAALSDLADVLRSEFVKLRSVRSTWWTLSIAVAANIVLAALVAAFVPARLSTKQKGNVDAIRLSLAGLHVGQIAFGVLGVLMVTSEYGSGMIRATFAAVPRRRLVLAAKSLVFAATALLVGVGACLAAFLVFQAFLPGDTMRLGVGNPGVLRSVLGGGLYLTALGLLGLGLGAVTRSSAGAIATLFGLLFVPVILADLLPDTWRSTIGPYLPMNAADQIYSLHPEGGMLAPWPGFAVFCLYGALALITGFALITRRDA